MSTRRLALLVTALTSALTGCSNGSQDAVVVFTASSLTGVFDDIPDVEVVAAGSQTLVAQLADGADADLLVTADRATMDRALADGSVAGTPAVIATNALVIAVAPDNPAGITEPGHLADADHTIGVCAPAVPCGALAHAVDAGLGIDIASDTEEPNVRALATKISLGEVDAGLVYATDAAAFDLETVGEDDLSGWRTEYLAATIDSDPADSVADVYAQLTGSEGARLLEAAGFALPDAGSVP